ncbi:MAG: RNA polymerase sigma factor [Xanthomonadales bacterium]|nr:RNA polymerase sigma factor [Xanthomonadales bacterium]
MTAATLPLNANALLQLNKAAPARLDPDAGRPDAWSDEALIEAIVKRGSEQHFRTLLARYKVRVHHIALSVLGPTQAAQAEDVAQEVFISLYRRLDQFRGDCKFSTWVYRLAVNAAIDFKRVNTRHAGLAIDDASLPGVPFEIPKGSDGRKLESGVHQALLALPESQRMMVYLYYWLELKMREIAEVLDCPQGTVKVYLKRARAALAETLGEFKHD